MLTTTIDPASATRFPVPALAPELPPASAELGNTDLAGLDDLELASIRDRVARLRRFLFGGAAEETAPDRVGSSEHTCFYRALVDGSLDIITVIDEAGTIVYESPSAERHLGYLPPELTGRNFFESVHPDDVVRVRARFDESVRHDTPSAPIELRLRHKSGAWRPFESVSRSQHALAGRRFGIIHSRDVSTRRLLEAEVRQAKKMEAVGISTGAIAHDFNNLLVVLAGYTALLGKDPSATVREYAAEMKIATDRATQLAAQLLAFSRPHAADDPSCDAHDVIEDFQPILDRMVGKDVIVSYSLGAAPARVPVLRSALEQVLINLTVNARDAMPAGGELTVSTVNELHVREGGPLSSRDPREYLVLTIADTGIGMTNDVKTRIFERFFTTKAPGRGTGIGLQTVFQIVQHANGWIDVGSAPGRGTTFRVLLPVEL